MTDVIVDTNVAVVANGQSAKVVLDCLEASIRFLIEVVDRHTALIDDGDAIRSEYSLAISDARPHQVGAQFLVHLLRNMGNEARVRPVHLPKNLDGEYSDFPDDSRLAAFDRSDRKFAALARRTQTPVTNATDSDWATFETALADKRGSRGAGGRHRRHLSLRLRS